MQYYGRPLDKGAIDGKLRIGELQTCPKELSRPGRQE